jgi:hypothetical protein
MIDRGAHLDVVAQMVDDWRRIHDGENGVLVLRWTSARARSSALWAPTLCSRRQSF